jgi:tetratricopeptide (TPR) repeat protein
LQAFADVSYAALEATRGKKADALRLYQSALKLDKGLNDPRSEAADWYGYGLFLRDAGFDGRLAYVSLLNAESLMQSAHDSADAEPIEQARLDLEKTLAGKADSIQRKRQPVIEEALSVSAR